ncbi:MAG: hypothetical protein L7H21_07225 [Sulfolobales archaeon]|jgi:uncharacterized protein (TIGR00304 family)|nr:hypothetical protein [Sulfolobales archaeon]MCQ4344224.1 hypothetical protein [Sulfolobales archaeon]
MNKAFYLGLALLLIGLALVMASLITPMSSQQGGTPYVQGQQASGQVSQGGVQGGAVAVIMIGPIPIIIGGGNPGVVQLGMEIAAVLIVAYLIISAIGLLRAKRRT